MWGSLSLAWPDLFLEVRPRRTKRYVLETKGEYRTFSGNDPCPLLCMSAHAHFLGVSMAVDDPCYLVCTSL